jgi:ABC-2 type transport system ATP-binding protein
MDAPAIEVHGLVRRFGDVLAVDRVDLRVERGEIYGFVGLNGAGKSTTIRALLGMIRPTGGTVRVLGEEIAGGGRGPWSRVGYLVDSPAAYPELTVRENLDIARRLQGVRDAGSTSRAIERFGLGRYADRRAHSLSTGNLQRLGLAWALLHEPELLVLDEPTNGLDPAGVVEIREMLRIAAAEGGTTVFMSSHILAELDRLATRIGIIHEGRLIEELEQGDLASGRMARLSVSTRDPAAARAALGAAGYRVGNGVPGTLVLDEARAISHPDEVARVLVAADVPPTRLAVEQEDLERHFLRRIGRLT